MSLIILPIGVALAMGAPISDIAIRKRDIPISAAFEATALGKGCASIPEPSAGIIGVQYYTDGRSSVEDRNLKRKNVDASASTLKVINYVGRLTARYKLSGGTDHASARCAFAAIYKWAASDALRGPFNIQGNGTRRWAVNALAVDFVEISRSSDLRPGQLGIVRDWFNRQAYEIRRTIEYQNNHLYWAAAAVAAAAVASGNDDHFTWAIKAATTGLNEVTAQGALPRELRRGRRALYYHAFAIEPLVQIAALARKRGIDLYKVNDHALVRLGDFIIEQDKDPVKINELSGSEQEWSGFTKDNLSWGEAFFSATGDCDVGVRLIPLRPLYKAYLGGNVTALYGISIPCSVPKR